MLRPKELYTVLGISWPCGKESYIEVSNPQDPTVIRDLYDNVLAGELFGFFQVDIDVTDNNNLYPIQIRSQCLL